jgi:Mg-chelatase subunit ChlD
VRHTLLLPLVQQGHCTPGRSPGADIALVIDTSSSMAGDKLAAAIGAAGSFLDLVQLPRDRVAVVTFDRDATLAAGLTDRRAVLQAALARATTDEGTRIDRGLAEGLAELSGPRGRREARKVLVLLTDGRPDEGTRGGVIAAAGAARAAGVTLFAIGLGADVDEALLRLLAGDPSRYYRAPGAGDLALIYRRIAAGIPCG